MDERIIPNNDQYTDFDTTNGCAYLACCVGIWTGCLITPCLYCRLTSQEISFEGNRLHFKYDSCLVKEDKLIPLDRIQDANISQNLCSRLCNVSFLNIQTANGSEVPEAVIIAPRDAQALRSMIMDRRDVVVHNSGSNGLDGVFRSQAGASAASASPLHSIESDKNVTSIRDSLQRIEELVAKGVQKFDRMEIR
jgi:membrane protein YdbS with pleckstrin-like domain